MVNNSTATNARAQRDWHLREAQDLIADHEVDPAHGLQAHQIKQRTLEYGANALPTAAQRSFWSLLRDQFSDFMILVLMAAAVVSGLMGEWVDALVILVIVLLNAAIGLVQSWRADQALAALQRLSEAQAMVLRSGQVQQVPAHVLVPGDIVLLDAGNQRTLQPGKEAFSHGVVVGIGHRSHGRPHTHFLATVAQRNAGVLAALVTVVTQKLRLRLTTMPASISSAPMRGIP